MAITEFIAAVELSSTKISGIAGKFDEEGTLQILAYSTRKSSSFIKKGVVYNLDKTSIAIKEVIKELETTLSTGISKVYVGISGQSVRTIKNVIRRSFDSERKLKQEDIDSVCDENISIPTPFANMEILEVAPQEFKIGNSFTSEPVGVIADSLEGHFMNIICRDAVKKSLEHSFKAAEIEIAELIVSPLAAASYLLTKEMKANGTALIDFGAETTTLTIFQNDILRYLTVIPLGSNSITKDLTSLKIDSKRAEEIKLDAGNLNYESEEHKIKETFFLDENRTTEVSYDKVNDIIRARAEEIVSNIWNQIQLSGYHNKLTEGIYITGGGSNLKGLTDLIHEITKAENVKQINPSLNIRCSKAIEEKMEIDSKHTLGTLLGLLRQGDRNCAKVNKEVVSQSIFAVDDIIEQQDTTANKDSKDKYPPQEQLPESDEKIILSEEKEEPKLKPKNTTHTVEPESKKIEKGKKKPSLFDNLKHSITKVQQSIFDDGDKKQ